MRSWFAALAVTAAGLAVLVWLIQAAPMTGDGQYYVEFVRNGLQHGASSWHERRLLEPLLVRALPLDPLAGFFVLTLASTAATALLMWRAAHTLLAIALLFGTFVVAANLREYALVDPLAWTFSAAVWLATVNRRWFLAAALAAVGVLAKEVVVLAAVAAAAASYERTTPWRPLAVAAPAIAVALLLTILFPGSGSDAVGYVLKWIKDGLGSLGPLRAIYEAFISYAALWLLVPLGWRALPRHLRRAAVVYVLAALALPFVGSPERMEEAIFPLVVTTAVLATRTWPPSLAWTLALANAVFVARIGGDARLPTLVAWAGLAVALVLVAWSAMPRAPLPFPRSALRHPQRRPQASASRPP